ncbi:hypothetical protein EI555_015206, partial [Monodon monoceros]
MSRPADACVVWMMPTEAAELPGPGGSPFPGPPRARTAETGAGSWFYHCEPTTRREKERRAEQLSEIPRSYKERILRDLDVSWVLPHLVYDGMFSLQECNQILSRDDSLERVDSFFLKLCSKGPKAFCAFCSHLEEFCPYLLTCFFLYLQEQTRRILQDVAAAEEKARVGTQPEPSSVLETEDRESLQLFN